MIICVMCVVFFKREKMLHPKFWQLRRTWAVNYLVGRAPDRTLTKCFKYN